MHLTYRPALLGDISACVKLLPQEIRDEENTLDLMPPLWRVWVRDGRMNMTVVEDEHAEGSPLVVGYGCSIFVTDEFMAEVNSTIEPPVNLTIHRRAAKNDSFVLTPQQIRIANSSKGLNLLVLNIGWDTSYDDESIRRIKAKLFEAFAYTHSGYFICEVSQEVYSTDEMERGIAIGAFLKNDFSYYYEEHPDRLPPADQRPYQIGGRRAEVLDGSSLSPLFLYNSPQFFFAPAEQDVLKLATIDMTDDEIADHLGLSVSAVHKRWQAVLDRATSAPVKWQPAERPRANQTQPVRGTEKRRHLLSYLRSHPEELRPVLPPVES